MSDLENQLQEVINEAKFPGIDAGRVTKYSAVVSHNGVLGSHAVIFHHNDQTGEKTEHDRMGSSAKGHEKAIYANIKKKYGNVMFEGFEEEDQLDELDKNTEILVGKLNVDENGKLIYSEYSDGFWIKNRYEKNDDGSNTNYTEDSDGKWQMANTCV